MDTTARLTLPFILPAQAQKHVTHNEALERLDALVLLSVVSRTSTEPPAGAVTGDRYIVGADATGDWTGKVGRIAALEETGWVFHSPREGWIAWCSDEAQMLVLTDGTWERLPASYAERLGVNTDPDANNRLSVRADSTLFSSENGSCRVNLNKSAAGETASFVFQDAFQGKAEIGLAGNDDLSVKVAAGGSWRTALTARTESGHVGIGTTNPSGPLHVRHDGSSAFIECWIEDAVNENVSLRLKHPGCQNNGFDFSIDSTESLVLNLRENAPMRFQTNNTERMRLTATGSLGIGTSNPTAALDVNGAIRAGQKTVATLPSAATVGAGAMHYVSDRNGGPALAVSDGAAWRFATLTL